MDAFIGEIRLFPYNFIPRGWYVCDGQQLALMQDQALFSILGYQYGGDGSTKFGLPDLRGRVAIGFGDDPNPADYFHPTIGSVGGVDNVGLSSVSLPSHTHTLVGSKTPPASRTQLPAGNFIGSVTHQPKVAGQTPVSAYAFYDDTTTQPTMTAMVSGTLTPFTGGGVAHENRQPYLPLVFAICGADGGAIYPARP